MDTNRGTAAARTVDSWRDDQTLYLPEFPPQKILDLRDSVEYPPEGSPDGPTRKRKRDNRDPDEADA